MRYAIYFTPGCEHPLTRAAGLWLGRDAFTGEEHPPPQRSLLASDEHARLTSEPRRYGFHATMVAPFRLSRGKTSDALTKTFSHFCAGQNAFEIPRLEIGRIGAFYALVPQHTSPALGRLAGDAVTAFAGFRAGLSAPEIEKRRPHTLTATQRRHLNEWGYPYVFDEFRFHMTLTGPTEPQDRERIERALHRWFDPILDDAVAVEQLALFTEMSAGTPFLVQAIASLERSKR